MSLKDPLYEEVHRRLMVQNGLTFEYTKSLIDYVINRFDIPEGVTISKTALSIEHVLGAMKLENRTEHSVDPTSVTMAGVDINGSSFCRITAVQGSPYRGSQDLDFYNLSTLPRLEKYEYVDEKEVSGRSTEGNWGEVARNWEGLTTDNFFRIRLVYEEGEEQFFIGDNSEYEEAELHDVAFLCMPAGLTIQTLGKLQDWLGATLRKKLVKVVVETFISNAPRLELVLDVHPTVIENSHETQLTNLKERNLQRLVEVLRIYPRGA
jgi:hypothetical protein